MPAAQLGLLGLPSAPRSLENHEALLEPDEDSFSDHGLAKAVEES